MVQKTANYSQYDMKGEKSLEEALKGLSQSLHVFNGGFDEK